MNRFKHFIARTLTVGLLLIAISVAALAQEQPLRIKYRLAMSHPGSHLFEISVDVDLPAKAKVESIDFQMARWSPGRYAVFDFAKNVQEVRAELSCLTQYDERGNPLPKSCPSSAVPVSRL